MSKTLYRYRIWCITDSKYEYVWKESTESAPSQCPVNSSHSVNSSSATIVEKLDQNETRIIETGALVQGYFQAKCIDISVPAQTGWHDFDFSFKVAISLFSATFFGQNEHSNDEGEFLIAPDSVLGNIAQDVNSEATQIVVPSSMIPYLARGFYIKLSDGTNTNDLGIITAIDTSTNTITVETATTNSFLASNTQVKRTVKMIPHITLNKNMLYQIGLSKIGGSDIAANTTIRFRYKNNDGLAKNFNFLLEYLY